MGGGAVGGPGTAVGRARGSNWPVGIGVVPDYGMDQVRWGYVPDSMATTGAN